MSVIVRKEGPPECAHIDRYIDDPSPDWVTGFFWKAQGQSGPVQKYNPEYQACQDDSFHRALSSPDAATTSFVDPRAEGRNREQAEKLIVAGVVVVSLLILAWR
jgi:hypothetical protein